MIKTQESETSARCKLSLTGEMERRIESCVEWSGIRNHRTPNVNRRGQCGIFPLLRISARDGICPFTSALKFFIPKLACSFFFCCRSLLRRRKPERVFVASPCRCRIRGDRSGEHRSRVGPPSPPGTRPRRRRQSGQDERQSTNCGQTTAAE